MCWACIFIVPDGACLLSAFFLPVPPSAWVVLWLPQWLLNSLAIHETWWKRQSSTCTSVFVLWVVEFLTRAHVGQELSRNQENIGEKGWAGKVLLIVAPFLRADGQSASLVCPYVYYKVCSCVLILNLTPSLWSTMCVYCCFVCLFLLHFPKGT